MIVRGSFSYPFGQCQLFSCALYDFTILLCCWSIICPVTNHPKMAFAAVRTVTVMERTLLDLLSDANERMDMTRSAEAVAVEVLAATISESDPAS
jgi:hypothetical protein